MRMMSSFTKIGSARRKEVLKHVGADWNEGF